MTRGNVDRDGAEVIAGANRAILCASHGTVNIHSTAHAGHTLVAPTPPQESYVDIFVAQPILLSATGPSRWHLRPQQSEERNREEQNGSRLRHRTRRNFINLKPIVDDARTIDAVALW